jgi:hypothetical protein
MRAGSRANTCSCAHLGHELGIWPAITRFSSDPIADAALARADKDETHLVQQRFEPVIFRYFAVKGLGTPA